jgi:hypothetical protein
LPPLISAPNSRTLAIKALYPSSFSQRLIMASCGLCW